MRMASGGDRIPYEERFIENVNREREREVQANHSLSLCLGGSVVMKKSSLKVARYSEANAKN